VIPSGLVLVLVAMLVPLTTATNRSSGIARIVIVAVLAAVIADGWLAYRSLRRLRVEIATPIIATSGRRFAARALVTGTTRPATIDGLFGDQAPRPYEPGEPFVLDCLPGQRGVFHHLLVEVRSRSPLGLWTAARRVGVRLSAPLHVGPHLRPFDAPSPEGSTGPDGDGRSTDRRGSDLTRTVRDYQPGDAARQVHWAATAHRGHLMVREHEAEQRPLPTVVVGATRAGPAAEAAFGRAATLVHDLLAASGAVRLVSAEPDGPRDAGVIPRSVLIPGAPPRGHLTEAGPVVTVDDVVLDDEQVRARLARAEPVIPAPPADATGPDGEAVPWPGAWWVTDEDRTDEDRTDEDRTDEDRTDEDRTDEEPAR